MSDVQKLDFGMQRASDGGLVEFGVVFPNGGFFPISASRAGDYDEALAADAQPVPSEQPQPEQPAEPSPEPPAAPVSEGQ